MSTQQSLAVVAEDKELESISEIIDKLPGKSEIMLEIFARLRPKQVFIFMSVSKSFLDFLTQPTFIVKHYVSFRRNTITAFLYQSIDPLDDYGLDYLLTDPMFLPIEHEAGPLPDPCLSFLNQRDKKDTVELLDSCNGLLLCSNFDWVTEVATIFVCNPLTREKVPLPHPRRPYIRLYFALLADFNANGYLTYKVVCLYRRKLGGPCHSSSEIWILSSETGEWKETKHEFPPVCHKTMMGSKVFVNGTLYWDCLEDHILVYRLNAKNNQSFYELIKAPRAPLGRCMWKCQNDKLHCYCHGFANEFPAWSLSIRDKNEYKWEPDGCEEFETLTVDVSQMYTKGWTILKKIKANTPRVRFKIIGYEPKSMTMYLFISPMIYSYQLQDRNFSLLGGVSPNGRVLPYVHSLGRIQTRNIVKAEAHGDNKEEEKTQDYPTAIDELEELTLIYEKLANKIKGKRR